MFRLSFVSVSLLLLFISCNPTGKLAQAPTNDPKDQLRYLPETFSPELIDPLLQTQTVFFYRKADAGGLDSLKQALTKAWTITPLLFADYREMASYYGNPKYSCFVLEGFTSTEVRATTSITNTHYYLVLQGYTHFDPQKKRPKVDGFCRIELYPNSPTLLGGGSLYNPKLGEIGNLYDHGDFFNWSPVLLAAHLKVVQENLKSKTRPFLYADVADPGLYRAARKDTLFVLDTEFKEFNKWTGRETKNNVNFSAYGAPFKVCSARDLFETFVVENRVRLLFEYVKSSTDKYVSVIDGKDGKYLYKKYSRYSYNLTGKDISAILSK